MRLTPNYRDSSLLARMRLALLAFAAAMKPRCGHQPRIADGGKSGAYGHWRCDKAKGHGGAHRAINYVWWADGETLYEPVPADLSSVARLA